MQETGFQSLGQEDPLEEGLATHSSVLAWRILWTEESGEIQSVGSHRIRHDWATEHHQRREELRRVTAHATPEPPGLWKQEARRCPNWQGCANTRLGMWGCRSLGESDGQAPLKPHTRLWLRSQPRAHMPQERLSMQTEDVSTDVHSSFIYSKNGNIRQGG